MGDFGVHIGPEAVFILVEFFPETDRAFVGKGDTDDGFDVFEPVFPRGDQTQRCTVLFGHFFAVDACGNHGQLVGGLGHRQAFDVRPRIPELTQARHGFFLAGGFHFDIFCA